jgi:DNA adenine methylase
MKTLTQPIKWHGGKHYPAPRIIALMAPHIHYVEPYFGGGSVLLARDPDDRRLWLPPHKGVSEVANDIHEGLTNFWRVLQDEDCFALFRRQVEAIPLSRTEWAWHHEHRGVTLVADAVAFFVDARQSRSGLMKTFTPPTRTRTRRQMNGNVSEWLGAVEGLADVHSRLKRVMIESMPAVDLIRREDTEGTLFYIDPPYLHETRTATDAYRHEMSLEQHVELLETLKRCKGNVMLSGYPSGLYADALDGWRRIYFDLPNNAAGGKTKGRETECLWMNWREP